MIEAVFWKTLSIIIGFAIVIGMILNFLNITSVPPQVLPFLVGCLISIAVAYSVVSRKVSPVKLEEQEERRFRRRQYIVGLIFSIILIILFLIPDVRNTPSSMIMIPIIFLGPVLVIREIITRRRNK